MFRCISGRQIIIIKGTFDKHGSGCIAQEALAFNKGPECSAKVHEGDKGNPATEEIQQLMCVLHGQFDCSLLMCYDILKLLPTTTKSTDHKPHTLALRGNPDSHYSAAEDNLILMKLRQIAVTFDNFLLAGCHFHCMHIESVVEEGAQQLL